MDATLNRKSNFPSRLTVYCNERFPLVAYGLLTALFSLAGLSLSQFLRGGGPVQFNPGFATAFFITFILFFQLRVADEFKDHDDDCVWAPERPVPRGLVTLNELGVCAMVGAALQVLACLLYKPLLLFYLAAVWCYFALMAREFFVAEYLRRRPIMYMLSHMFILVLTDLFITAVDFAPGPPPHALIFFFVASFASGMVIEVGRKLKGPAAERQGIVTYTKALGLIPASALFLFSVLTAQIFLSLSLHSAHAGGLLLFVPLDLSVLVFLVVFCRKPDGKERLMEGLASFLTALAYGVVILVCFSLLT